MSDFAYKIVTNINLREVIFLSTRDLTLVALFAALTAVGAFIRIPIPYVPFTLQLFFVLLAGVLLGSRLGALSQIVYVVTGLLGVPIFTQGGGPSYVLQPTFGYLLGFICCAYLVGKFTEGKKTYGRYLWSMYLGVAVVYLLGVIHLYLVTHFLVSSSFTLAKALWFGAVICLPPDIIITAATAWLAQKIVPRIPREA